MHEHGVLYLDAPPGPRHSKKVAAMRLLRRIEKDCAILGPAISHDVVDLERPLVEGAEQVGERLLDVGPAGHGTEHGTIDARRLGIEVADPADALALPHIEKTGEERSGLVIRHG